MSDDLRVGLVGANAGYGWGKAAHVPALAAARGVRLHAVSSRSEASAREAATAFDAPLAFADHESLVACPEVDIVAVSVRAPAHRAVVMAALAAGKPVYCEWPLGASLAETQEMALAAARAGVPTAIGLQGRHSPWLIHLRETITSGAIGRVLAANFLADDDLPYGAVARSNAYMLAPDGGANILTIQAGHFLDAVAFALGEFASLSGIAARTRDHAVMKDTGQQVPLGVPDQVAVAARLEGGAVLSAQVIGGTTPGPAMSLIVQGTEGVLRATSGGYMHWRPVAIEIARNGASSFESVPLPESLATLPHASGVGADYVLACAYTRFAEALRAGTRFRPDFEDALVRHRAIAAVSLTDPPA